MPSDEIALAIFLSGTLISGRLSVLEGVAMALRITMATSPRLEGMWPRLLSMATASSKLSEIQLAAWRGDRLDELQQIVGAAGYALVDISPSRRPTSAAARMPQ